MAKKYLLSIDEGTMGSRACIFDIEGNLIASSGSEYSVVSPKPGWYEQDCLEMNRAIYDSCKRAIKKASINPNCIVAVGLSSQGGAFVPVDKNNEIIRPCIGWQDDRGKVMFEKMKDKISFEEYYNITGVPFCTSVWSISKILWMKEYEPENFEKTNCIALHQDYFLTALGVEGHYADISSASRYGFFDINNGKFDDKLLKIFEIPKDKLPKIVEGGSIVGKINRKTSGLTDIPEGVPICAGAMDVNSSMLGLGVIKEGIAGTILGTYGTCLVFSSKPIRDPNGKMVVMGNVGTNKWTMEGSSLAAASSFRWYRDTFCDMEVATGKLIKEDAFQLIDKQIINSSSPGAKGLLFIPHLASAGAPRNNEKARGLFFGLNFSHTKPDIARAVMEGICLEIRDIITEERNVGAEIDQLRITGGATKSAIWNQIQADVYGRPVQTVQTSETGALGAAMLAAVGVGIFKDVYEAANNMIHVTESYEPSRENTKIYDELYDIYNSVYKGLLNEKAYDKIVKLQDKLFTLNE